MTLPSHRLGTSCGAMDCRPPNRRSRRWNDAERLGEIVGLEFRPHPLGEMQFGVGAFPEQEVRQPLLAAGADDEIDVAQVRLRR